MGYFDFEYQLEYGQQGSIINADKHVYYRDVYVFVDRLKDLTIRYKIIYIIILYLRDSAFIWYSTKLTDLERTGFRTADPVLWYITLINRFKMRTTTILSQLIKQTYSLHDIKHTSSRAFIQQMLYLIKSIEFYITYNQLTLFWNQFVVNLRRNLSKSQSYIIIDQFLEQMNVKTPIWLEFVNRQSQQRQWQHGIVFQDPVSGRYTNGQKDVSSQQQHAQPYRNNNRLLTRISTNDSKAHAYLVEITPNGYGIYEKEDETYQKYQ